MVSALINWLVSHFELTWLEMTWIILAFLNIGVLGLYILFMRYIAIKKPWNIKIDPSYEPTISIIIPTYNEEKTIKKKLDNLLQVDYPKEKIEIIVVDSASSDKTPEIVEEWAKKHPEIKLKFIREPERRGMVPAINHGVKYAQNKIILKTDADCFLLKDSIKNAVKYLADEGVGSVAGLHIIKSFKETNPVNVEKTYRNFYRWLRIGESKLWSTVLYEGEFMLIKRRILEEVGGFDENIGADDVPIALKLAANGYRAIIAQDVYFIEMTPYSWRERLRQKVRRGRHVIQSLVSYSRKLDNTPLTFKLLIYPMEAYIYIINPVLFIPLMVLSILILIKYSILLILSMLLLSVKPIRQLLLTHFSNVTIMVIALFKECLSREPITWTKILEIR